FAQARIDILEVIIGDGKVFLRANDVERFAVRRQQFERGLKLLDGSGKLATLAVVLAKLDMMQRSLEVAKVGQGQRGPLLGFDLAQVAAFRRDFAEAARAYQARALGIA